MGTYPDGLPERGFPRIGPDYMTDILCGCGRLADEETRLCASCSDVFVCEACVVSGACVACTRAAAEECAA